MSLLGRWMGQRPAQPQTTMAAPLVAPGKPGPISHADAKQFGFVNFGNTCYANSVLQALYFCGPFRELVCASPDRSALFPTPPPLPALTVPQPSTSTTTTAPAGSPVKPATAPAAKPKRPNAANGEAQPEPVDSNLQGLPIPTQPPTLFSALRALFIHISLHPVDRATVSPSAFVAKLKQENELFSGTMHQDAHEFLNYLLNKIVEDLGEEEKLVAQDELSKSIVSLAAPSTVNSNSNSATGHNHATLVHSLFEGTLTSETRCLTCETVSSRDESFLDLSIDIEQNSSVTACLRQFSASEMLCEKNKFFCDSCCGLQEAERRMKVKKLPNVLALHLKRFKYQEDLQKYIKLSYRVAFPFELRLFNTVDDAPNPDRLYELFAIVVHIGGGPHHGHYITIVKSRGVWLVYDDDSVDTIKEKDIPRYFGDSPGGAGYVLFYEAADLDPASVGIVRTEPPLQTPSDLSVRGGNSEPSATTVSSETGSEKGETSIPPSPNTTSIVHSRPPLNLDIPLPSITDPPPASPILEVQSATVSSGNQGGLSFITRSLRPSASMRANRLSLNSNTSSNGHPPVPKSPSMPFKNFGSTLPKATTLSPEVTLNGKEKEKDKEKDKKWFGSRKVKAQRNSVQPPLPPLPPQPGSHSVQPTVLYEDGNGGLSNRRPSAVSSRSSNDYRRPSAPAALESHSLSPVPPLPVNDASSESSSSFAAENTTASTTPTGSNASKRNSTLIFPPTPNTLLVPTPDMTPRSSTSVTSSNTTTIVTASSSQSHALMNHSRPTSTTSLNSRSSPTPGAPPSIPPLLPDPPPSPRAFKQSVKGVVKAKKVAEAADKKVREKAEKEREKAEREREKAEKERERAEAKAEKEREKAEREREREREKAERDREKSEKEWERVEREREERDVVEGEHRQHEESGLKAAKSLKRASRKLSFSAIPVSGIFTGGFGKKDRDRDTSHPPSSMPPPTTTIHPIAASGPPPARTPRSPERQPDRTAIRIETQPRFGF